MKWYEWYNGFEIFIVKAITAFTVGFLVPVQSWLLFMYFFSLFEWLTYKYKETEQRRRKEKVVEKSFIYLLVECSLLMICIVQAFAFEKGFFPSYPITQGLSAAISGWKFKQTISNVSYITGTDIWSILIKSIEQIIKNKKL